MPLCATAGGPWRPAVSKHNAMTLGVILSSFGHAAGHDRNFWPAAAVDDILLPSYNPAAQAADAPEHRRRRRGLSIDGWAAATGQAPWQAWLLFLIIFLWTPPHSWALALYSAGDYARAGIPMMPVARGAKSTRLQILIYSLVFVPVAVAPGLLGLGGFLYLAVSALGGLGFLFLAVRLWRSRAGDQPDKAEAVGREAALYDVRVEAKPARNLFASRSCT
jgi:hypothetical protein